MSFLSCSYYEPWWTYPLTVLLEGTADLMIYSTPVAICAVIAYVFADKESKSPTMTVLGLDASAETYLPSADSHFPMWTVLLYLITGVLTFELGLLVFDFVQALSLPTFRLGLLVFDAVHLLS